MRSMPRRIAAEIREKLRKISLPSQYLYRGGGIA
jgi:hypothetical protein